MGWIDAVVGLVASTTPMVIGAVQSSIAAQKTVWDQIGIAERNYIVTDIFNDAFSGKYGDDYKRQVELNIMQFQISENGKTRKVNDIYEFFQIYPVYAADYKQREIRYELQRDAQKGKRSIYVIFGGLAVLLIVGIVIAQKYGSKLNTQ